MGSGCSSRSATTVAPISVVEHAATDALQYYVVTMKDKINGVTKGFLNDDDLEKCHNSAKLEAMRRFKQFQREPMDQFLLHNNKLDIKIRSKMGDFKLQNAQNKQRAEDEATRAIASAKNIYEENMMNQLPSDKYVKEVDFTNTHDAARRNALEACSEKCKKFPRKLQQLEADLDASRSRKWSENEGKKSFGRIVFEKGVEVTEAVIDSYETKR